VFLSASGLLEHEVGSPSVFPPIPADVAGQSYANNFKWKTSEGADRYRRGMYTFFQRTSPYPMLMTFDSPDSTACTAQRSESNTPLQALTLWNDRVFFECSQQLGRRIKQLGGLVPGSMSVRLGGQTQPSSNTTDVVAAIKGVIEAEEAACAHYKKVIKATDGEDYVTQDLCIRLLADEEEHLVLFRGFLKEYAP